MPWKSTGVSIMARPPGKHKHSSGEDEGCQACDCSWRRGQLPLPQPRGERGHGTEFSLSQQCSRLPPPLLHRHHHSHAQQALPWAHLSIHPPGPPPQPQDPSWDPAQPQKEDGVKQRAHPCSAGTKGVCMPCPASGEAQTAPRHRAPPGLQHL